MVGIEITLPTFYLQELYDFLTSVLDFQLEEQEEGEVLLRYQKTYLRIVKRPNQQTTLIDPQSLVSSLSFLVENQESLNEVMRKFEFFSYRTEGKFAFFNTKNLTDTSSISLQDIEGRIWIIKVLDIELLEQYQDVTESNSRYSNLNC